MLLLEHLGRATEGPQVLEHPLGVPPGGGVGRGVAAALEVLHEPSVEHHRRQHDVAERAAELDLAAHGAHPLAECRESLPGLGGANPSEILDSGAREQQVSVQLLARARNQTGWRSPVRRPVAATGSPA